MLHAGTTARYLALAAAAILSLAATVMAAPIALPLTSQDYASLGVTTPATTLVTSSFDFNERLMGQVSSQAFNLADGNYLYLYQANNTGSTVLDVLSVYPTYGLLSAGSLSANAPTGFLAGGTLPSGVSWDQALGANNLEYDYFPSAGGSIAVGSHSVAMYMISSYSPIVGEGFVIDSGVAMVSAVVAPEPATLGFLAIGLAAGLARRLRRR